MGCSGAGGYIYLMASGSSTGMLFIDRPDGISKVSPLI